MTFNESFSYETLQEGSQTKEYDLTNESGSSNKCEVKLLAEIQVE